MRPFVLLAFLVLASCSGLRNGAPVADVKAVAAYRGSGYAPVSAVAIRTRIFGASENELPWHVALTRAADHASRPLVIFLPGLGEAAEAPNQWVDAWAAAGNAVLVVQALAEDADAWASPDARSGEFQRVARQRFAPDLMPGRLAQLAATLKRVQARSARGDDGLDALDWSHVVVAGADLGAYTVQTLAGDAAGFPVAPLAYIVISPHVVAGAAPASAGAPVLMISAREDIDDYGLVTDPIARHKAFDALKPGQNLFLELPDASHRWLAGIAPSASAPGLGADSAHRSAPMSPQEPGSRRGRSGTMREGVAPSSDEEEPTPEQKARSAAALVQRRNELSQQLTRNAMSEVSFTAVSLAFLDAQLRGRREARAWLETDAARWLQGGTRLKHG